MSRDKYKQHEEYQRLVREAEQFKQRNDITEGRIKNLNLQMEAVQRRILSEKRLKALKGGANASVMQQGLLKRKIVLLEMKHERIKTICNKCSVKVDALRTCIIELRKEFLIEQRMFEALGMEFTRKQRDMAALMAESNRLYESRDRAVQQLQVLKQVRLGNPYPYIHIRIRH
jgi:hypothetical protein